MLQWTIPDDPPEAFLHPEKSRTRQAYSDHRRPDKMFKNQKNAWRKIREREQKKAAGESSKEMPTRKVEGGQIRSNMRHTL
jgi:hypothetical protein